MNNKIHFIVINENYINENLESAEYFTEFVEEIFMDVIEEYYNNFANKYLHDNVISIYIDKWYILIQNKNGVYALIDNETTFVNDLKILRYILEEYIQVSSDLPVNIKSGNTEPYILFKIEDDKDDYINGVYTELVRFKI